MKGARDFLNNYELGINEFYSWFSTALKVTSLKVLFVKFVLFKWLLINALYLWMERLLVSSKRKLYIYN
ncbi:hypothetical protein BK640_19930 [Pseudomonas protegens]|nr:hypothetical protein BK639_02795 [Pseudomonas protegens]ROM00319.1 hypothetical protein BK640_19930 [Pseudomonas protegens]ROM06608.1 hypothetical protein BK641_08625 [Pseudomonas protegens]ROM14052.1 hypothetical protein BK642_00165 [Pseudomonas protegens]